MPNLTNEQVLAILALHRFTPSLFAGASVKVGDTGTYVDIFSQPNADYTLCDGVLWHILPECEHQKPNVVICDDGTLSENFRLVDPSGAIITLYMKKCPGQKEMTPTPIGATKKIEQHNYTPDDKFLEEIIRG